MTSAFASIFAIVAGSFTGRRCESVDRTNTSMNSSAESFGSIAYSSIPPAYRQRAPTCHRSNVAWAFRLGIRAAAFPGPETDTEDAIARIEREIGALPLALKIFWRRVGSINFIA